MLKDNDRLRGAFIPGDFGSSIVVSIEVFEPSEFGFRCVL